MRVVFVQVQDMPSLTTYLADMGRQNNGAFFGWYVSADSHHPDRRAFFVSPGGTTLPDKSYYVSVRNCHTRFDGWRVCRSFSLSMCQCVKPPA